MKKTTIVVSLGIVLGLGINLALAKKPAEEQGLVEETQPKAEAEETQGGVQMEEYVPKVIIEAKRGNGQEEFGSYTSGTRILGPVAMDVDNDGNIYIFDPVNWRVVVYDNENNYKLVVHLEKDPKEIIGKQGYKGGYALPEYLGGSDIIKVDSKKNIYIHVGDDPVYMVRKFNIEGTLTTLYIENYPNFGEISSTSKTNKYNIYFRKLKKENKLVIFGNKPEIFGKGELKIIGEAIGRCNMRSIFPSEYFPIWGYIEDSPFLMISSNYDRKKKVIFFKFPGYYYDMLPEKARKIVENFSKYKEKHSVIIIDEDGNIENWITIETKNVHSHHPWKEDIYGNLYVMVWIEDERNIKPYIYKYNSLGKLTGIIEILAPLQKDGPKPFVSWNGNVYQIFWENNRLKVIKWEVK
jgi:hypothetical protein